jgi:hypothetical protein
MSRKIVFSALAAVVATLLMASKAQAWGAYHVGYTHVGYGGVQHYSHTVAAGPYGAYSGFHVGGFGNVPFTAYSRFPGYTPGWGPGGAVGVYNYGYSPYGGYYSTGFGYTGAYPGYVGGVYPSY